MGFNKGQIILKQLLVYSDSSKKTNDRISFFALNSTKNKVVRSFFGRIRGYQKVLLKLSDLYSK
jgi:hypothetical protein